MSPDDRRLRAFAWGWLVIGALAFASGALMMAAGWLFTANSVRTEGVVLRHENREGGIRDLSGRYVSSNVVPVVQFHDGDGQVHEIHGQVVRLETRVPAPGASIPVRYQRLVDGTVSARIDRPLEIWGLPGFMTGFGALMFGGGLIARRAARGRLSPGGSRRPRVEDWNRILQRRR